MRRAVLVSLPLSVLLLAACSGGVGDPSPSTSEDPTVALGKTRDAFVAAKSVHLALTSEGIPTTANGVSGATGTGVIDKVTPKFAGTVTGRVQGTSATIDVIAIGRDTWLKLFTPTFEKADLAKLGAPNPATFFNPDTGIAYLFAGTTGVKQGEQVRDGQDVLDVYTATVPGGQVRNLLRVGDATKTYQATFGVAPEHELRTVSLTGELYPGTTSTYTLRLADYGQPASITAP
ncbi:LppX_LprAFG lipoprotein [Arsenicicoccus piscis]|uniref:LppX_LprAFG lipoprotein n=1 Tax=Arsenicicoccus piscis TaxID=673954 RepID=A0ABQ6HRR4_9MICO|nr:LppX_LprAFG lipoprotein [Arsenicicoccus piscis]MCH8626493.1 LppX_LprAFG lipoprotein [Arsenicicoccus piscis]GMA21129.1 hypothetical protein GCM10025862_31500 [Arsenicicoccus piscis]